MWKRQLIVTSIKFIPQHNIEFLKVADVIDLIVVFIS